MIIASFPVAALSLSLALASTSTNALAQQACPQSLRAGEIDPTAIQRKAKDIADLNVLLADPDANVRLLAVKQAITSCDVTIRDTAIEHGLASNETALVTAALRGTLVGRDALILRYNNAKEPAADAAENASWVMTIDSYDPLTGKIGGRSPCTFNDRGEWAGTVSAAAITFVVKNNSRCSGRLDWDAEKAQFKGKAIVERQTAERPVTWNPF